MKAMTSSTDHQLKEEVVGSTVPPPKEERPIARRKIWSMWARAAVVAGEVVEEDSVVREVASEGKGRGMWVARNMW